MKWLFLIGIILFILDFTVFNPGLIFVVVMGSFFIYMGKSRLDRLIGKVTFGIGVLILITAIFSTVTFQIIMITVLIIAVTKLFDAKKQKDVIKPTVQVHDREQNYEYEKVKRKTPLFRNVIWGKQETRGSVYEWEDINIQTGIGDCIIDLSNTVLPEGTSVISIRSLVSDITILVPYEQEVSIHHSAIAGSLQFFDEKEPNIINRTIYMQTENFDITTKKVKIITSCLYGKIEVKRI